MTAETLALDTVIGIAGGGNDYDGQFPKRRRIAGSDMGEDLGAADFGQAKIEQENRGFMGGLGKLANQEIQDLLAVEKSPNRPTDSDPFQLPFEEMKMAFIVFGYQNQRVRLHILPFPKKKESKMLLMSVT